MTALVVWAAVSFAFLCGMWFGSLLNRDDDR